MTLITSLANPHVAQIRDLHTTKGRKKSGLLLMEGPHLLDALLLAEMLPREIYYQPDLLQRTPEGRALLARLLHPPVSWSEVALFEVSERVAEALSDAQTSQGVYAVVPLHLFQPARLLARRPSTRRPALLVLDDLADPGNMGTILRTALAADVQEVLLTPHCVDCYSPKVVRAAAGAHVALPVWTNLAWSAIEERIAAHCGVVGGRVFSAEASGSQLYYMEDLRQPFALIIGNEAHGISSQARALANRALSIPLANQVESLNAAMATGIFLFEAVRQLHFVV
ncbi:MAG TPA: RNA methyltransferase [Ktedonobacteraceae bacterium]|nr:RNA methyltransferase [Ktedonobacteraceae bacterium]